MVHSIDQTGRALHLANPAKRIVSLVPSQTELLAYLNLNEEVVGITRFCIHPKEWHQSKQRVGGTKDFKAEVIRALKPDLIIANKEENEEALLTPLMSEYPVWISDVATLEDALEMIREIGQLCARENAASALVTEIQHAFASLHPIEKPVQTLYLIWQNPYMTIGKDTFIYDLLNRCGLAPVSSSQMRYPIKTADEISHSGAELVLLSSEPFPFSEKHLAAIQQLLPKAQVILCDGEYFSWYGSRLRHAPSYFRTLLQRIVR